MQSSILVGTDFRPSLKSNTLVGQTARHKPQPLHQWGSTVTVNFFGKKFTFLRDVQDGPPCPWSLCHLVRFGTRLICIYILNIALQIIIYQQVKTILSCSTGVPRQTNPEYKGMTLNDCWFDQEFPLFKPSVMKHPDGDPWILAQYLLSKKFTRYWAEHETMPRVAAGKEKPLDFVSFA